MRFITFGIGVFASLFLIAGCFTGQNPQNNDDNDSIDIDSTITELDLYEKRKIPTSVDDNFEDFFYAFVTEQEFMMQRILFPLEDYDPEYTTYIDKDQWEDNDVFANEQLYTFIYSNDKDIELLKNSTLSSVRLQWVTLDSCLINCYDFRKEDGLWRLTKLERIELQESYYDDFINFYKKFVNDKDFQVESISYPIQLKSSGSSEMDEGGDLELYPDDWMKFQQEVPLPDKRIVIMDYNQTVTWDAPVNMLIRGITNEMYINYHFERNNGQWKLTSVEF